MSNPFGRAIRDWYHGDQSEPLIQRDGEETHSHPIEQFYFEPFPDAADGDAADWLESWLSGPLLDIGAGAGRHALYFQQQFETVAIEPSDPLVETMCDRGVQDACHGDMFKLREQFERDRFQSALAIGTQLGLVKSMHGLETFLADLASVTTDDATAVVDCFDPTVPETAELLGYREDSTPGLAFRVMGFEYQDELGETLLFRLFSPDRLREATAETDWTVVEITRPMADRYYRAALEKQCKNL